MTDVVRRERRAASDLVMGRYRLEERLGLGGSAEVWRGIDERLGRPVAVKVLHAHLLPDEAARTRFEREARAAAALAHPGIVAVYDVEASESGAAIVFELVEGETLADRLAREGALVPSEAARIGAELAQALAHAHERGIVHRDVKPGNVLLERDGRARLVDFGIARLIERESSHLTTAGMITGTLRYLAPEQLASDEATAATDLYALGVVLFEMLAGHPPFEAATLVALAEAQRHPPAEIPDVPPALAAISLEAMDPDPARRPASAADMAARLSEWAAGARVPLEDGLVDDGAGPLGAGSDAPTIAMAQAAPAIAPGDGPSRLGAADALPAPRGAGRTGRSPRPRPRRPWLAPLLSVAALGLAVVLFAGIVLSGAFAPTSTNAPRGGLVGPSPTLAPAASATPVAQPTRHEPPGKKRGKGPG